MNRACPDDGTALQPQAHCGLTLDACPRCAGVYFDEGEISALQQKGSDALNEVEDACVPGGLTRVDTPYPKRCPGCGKSMWAYAYRYSSDIRLDGCEACGGVWVQDGELAKIAAHLAAPPVTFGGTPAARRAAESHNAARHGSLLAKALGHLHPAKGKG